MTWILKPRWTRKQKAFRRACRAEEKEVEQLINWLEINMSAITRKTQNRLHHQQASGVAPHPDKTQEDPSTAFPEALVDEFGGKTAAEGDCCTCTKCPCHSTQQEEASGPEGKRNV